MSATKIKLDHPVEIGGEIVKAISIRPPTEEDLAAVRLLNVGRLNRGLRFLARLVDVPREALQDLAPSDQRKIDGFLREHGV